MLSVLSLGDEEESSSRAARKSRKDTKSTTRVGGPTSASWQVNFDEVSLERGCCVRP